MGCLCLTNLKESAEEPQGKPKPTKKSAPGTQQKPRPSKETSVFRRLFGGGGDKK